MAPRKQTVTRRFGTTGQQERRTKARHEGTSRGQPAAPPSPPVQAQVTDSCAGKVITTGRRIDFRFFQREGFSIGAKLRAMGWEYLCSLDVPTYPGLVREFYSSFARGSGGIICKVRGIEMTITDQLLAQVLRMSTDGPTPNMHSDRQAIMRRILEREDVNPLEEIPASQLSVEMRLLHSIISRILFPKTGRFDYISERDLVLMHHILEGAPVNLPRMMMMYMSEAATKSKASLPYGMVLTLLFREFNVHISEEEPKRSLRHTDVYNDHSLRRMGYLKRDGQWTRRGVERRRMEEVEEEEEEAPESPTHVPTSPSPMPTPSQQPSTSSTATLDDDQMKRLAVMIVDELNSRGQTLIDQSHLAQIAHNVTLLEQHHSTTNEHLLNEVKTISTSLSKIDASNSEDLKSIKESLEKYIQKIEAFSSEDSQFSTILASLEKLIAKLDQTSEPLRVYSRTRTSGPSHSAS